MGKGTTRSHCGGKPEESSWPRGRRLDCCMYKVALSRSCPPIDLTDSSKFTSHLEIAKMVSFKALVTAALALISSALATPADTTALVARQGSPWQWWTEGQGQFSCQQQGGGKYSCNWNGKAGGGMVAGTGWGAGRKYVFPIHSGQ